MLSIAQTQVKDRAQGSSIASTEVNHKGTKQNGEGWIWRGELRKPIYASRVTQVVSGQVAASLIQGCVSMSVLPLIKPLIFWLLM